MRRGLVLTMLVALSGCGSSDGQGGADSGPPPPPPPPPAHDSGAHDSASAGDQGAPPPVEAGNDAKHDADLNGPPHGTIDPTGKGGTVNRLAFTAFGDIRPALPDEDWAYPNMTVQQIMSEMDALNPEFAVATGDYMFVELLPSSAASQVMSLLGDEKPFTSPIFHTMGNHECQSFSDVNCPMLNESVNITTYLSMLVPWSKVPWFSFIVHTDLGDANFVFIAVNAWNSDQQTWLETTMAMPTKYTFVIRHHPTPDAGSPSSAEGIAGSDAILNKYTPTLFLFGHVHEYSKIGDNRVVTGNGGAPLDSGEYGYLYVEQRADGNVVATEYAMGGGSPVDSFVVTPDGKPTK